MYLYFKLQSLTRISGKILSFKSQTELQIHSDDCLVTNGLLTNVCDWDNHLLLKLTNLQINN